MTDEEMERKLEAAFSPWLAAFFRRGLLVGVVLGIAIGFLACLIGGRRGHDYPQWLRDEWGLQ